MGQYIPLDNEVTAVQFTGDNLDEFKDIPGVEVRGPFDPWAEFGVSIEVFSDNYSFELYEGEWGVFWPSGKAEFFSDDLFHKTFRPANGG